MIVILIKLFIINVSVTCDTQAVNRGKESISLNLKSKDDISILR